MKIAMCGATPIVLKIVMVCTFVMPVEPYSCSIAYPTLLC